MLKISNYQNMNKVKFLLATLFITLTASLSYAADIKGTDFKKDGISYEINSDGNTVTVLFGPITGNLVIPSTVENNGKTYTITAIAAMAFYECPDLKSVTLPGGIPADAWRLKRRDSVQRRHFQHSPRGGGAYDGIHRVCGHGHSHNFQEKVKKLRNLTIVNGHFSIDYYCHRRGAHGVSARVVDGPHGYRRGGSRRGAQ